MNLDLRIYFLNRIPWLLVCCLLAYFPTNIAAQESVSFQHLSTEDGLSQVSVFAIAQDSAGFMWFGTRNGLNKFDGYQFRVYQKTATENSIVSNDIRSLYVDPKTKHLWVGTALGLSQYDISNDRFSNYLHEPTDDQTISGNFINHLLRDSKGRLWIATTTGLSLYEDEKQTFQRFFTNENTTENCRSCNVQFLLEDAAKQLWIGTRNGLYRMIESDEHSFDFERIDQSQQLALSATDIQSMAEDSNGNLWIGTFEDGINYWNRKKGSVTAYRYQKDELYSLSDDNIRTIVIDEQDNLWVGTKEGINFLEKDEQTFQIFQKDELERNGLKDDSVHAIFLDARASLWIGTYYGGIHKLSEHYNWFVNFRHHPNTNSLSGNIISSFVEDENGNLWIGTEGDGLNFWNRSTNQFEQYTYKADLSDGLSGNNIKQLMLDGNKLWIGTFQAGLNRLNLDTRQFEVYKKKPNTTNALSNNSVYGLQKIANKIWTLTYGGGLDVLDVSTDTFYHFSHRPNDSSSISSDLTRVILSPQQQQVWIGTENGLNKVDVSESGLPIKFQTFLKGKKIYALQRSFDQSIWIGTFTNGLYHFNPTTEAIKHFTTADGLAGNTIFGILEVNSKELWLSTNKGLTKFNFQEKLFTNYNYSSGIGNMVYNFNAYYETSKGELLFGGLEGFTLIHPEKIQTNDFIPPVVFTELSKNNQVIRVGDEKGYLEQDINETQQLVFNYNEANFSIGFAALDYLNPENNHYTYILKGLEPEWNTTIGEHKVTYAIQRSGEYIFRLKGSNSDGLWNEKERQLTIKVLPPPWKSWWAYLIYFATATLLVLGLMRFIRLRHSLELQRIAKQQQAQLHESKLRFFTNITHEFRTPLTLILGPVNDLLSNKNVSVRATEQLTSIQKNAHRLLKLVDQILTFRKLASENEPLQLQRANIVSFVKEIYDSFLEMANARQINYEFRTKTSTIEILYDADKLEKVFYNLLSNAFKFTRDGGSIVVQISQDADQVEIKVADDGIGVPAELHDQIFKRFFENSSGQLATVKGTGIGLAISRQLVELHQGTIFIAKDKGTSVFKSGATFVVQIPKGEILRKQNQIINDLASNPVSASKMKSKREIGMAKEAKTDIAQRPTILIIDDHQDIRKYVTQIFEADYELIEAVDGEAGFEMAKKHLPHLILSDVMMPKLDGIALCKKLKVDITVSHIPIILLTAKSTTPSKIEGLKIGADDYITKPFEPEELRLRVRNIIKAREAVKEKFVRVLAFDPKEISISSQDELFLQKAFKIVESNIENPNFNIDRFATELAVSRPLLFTKTKALTGQTPNNFIKTIRLKRAAQLLSMGKLNVSEIAYQVGFKDPKYFRKCFKDQFSTSPSEYRDNRQQSE
ncbi:MAG: two-component regulator propeller domain-containing protein [Bacteroidota bacterium]